MANVTIVKTKIDHYEINLSERLGRGTYGTVYVCRDTKSGDRVAVKVMEPPEQHAERYEKYYIRELNSLKSSNHPHIVALLHHKRVRQCVYLFLELCKCDLQHFARKQESLDQLKYPFIEHILSAIQYLHSRRIIHRDIKPENMLIKEQDDQYTLKLSDLGLSKRISEDASSGASFTPGVGTLIWMAPEVIRDPRRPTARLQYESPSDCFSAGLNLQSVAVHTPRSSLSPITENDQPYGEYIAGLSADDRSELSPDLRLDGHYSELQEMIRGLLHPDAELRWKIDRAYETILHIKDTRGYPGVTVAREQQPTTEDPVSASTEPTSTQQHQEPTTEALTQNPDSPPSEGAALLQQQVPKTVDIKATSRLKLPFKAHGDVGICSVGNIVLTEKKGHELFLFSLSEDGEFSEQWRRKLPDGILSECRICVTEAGHVLLQNLSYSAPTVMVSRHQELGRSHREGELLCCLPDDQYVYRVKKGEGDWELVIVQQDEERRLRPSGVPWAKGRVSMCQAGDQTVVTDCYAETMTIFNHDEQKYQEKLQYKPGLKNCVCCSESLLFVAERPEASVRVHNLDGTELQHISSLELGLEEKDSIRGLQYNPRHQALIMAVANPRGSNHKVTLSLCVYKLNFPNTPLEETERNRDPHPQD